jgi:hypothetical protein
MKRKMMPLRTRVTGFLAGWLEVTRALERALVDNLAATTPWLSPVVPAYIALQNMTEILKFHLAVALIGAATVEFLGLATVYTLLALWDYNSTKELKDPKAPLPPAVATAAGYILVILVVNVILDSGPLVNKIAKALLSLLSVIGAVTLAVRAQHARRLEERGARLAQEARERKAAEAQARVERAARLAERRERYRLAREAQQQDSGKILEREKNLPERVSWRNLSGDERRKVSGMPVAEIVQAYGIHERTATNWRKWGAGGNGNGKA